MGKKIKKLRQKLFGLNWEEECGEKQGEPLTEDEKLDLELIRKLINLDGWKLDTNGNIINNKNKITIYFTARLRKYIIKEIELWRKNMKDKLNEECLNNRKKLLKKLNNKEVKE